jgi:hypothetical protein
VSTTNAAALALDARIRSAEAAHVLPRDLAPARRTASDAAATLQKARADLKAGAYLEAMARVNGLEAKIHAQMKEIEAIPPPRATRPARRTGKKR